MQEFHLHRLRTGQYKEIACFEQKTIGAVLSTAKPF